MQKLDITIKPSRLFLFFVLALLVGSIAIITQLSLHWLVKVVMIIVTVAYVMQSFRRVVLLADVNSILRISHQDTSWQICSATHAKTVELLSESTVTSWLMVLLFKEISTNKVCPLIIFRDSLSLAEYKHLVVRAKFAHQ